MRVRERTLYDYICRVFDKYGWKCYSQVGVERKEPDLIIEREDVGIVSEVKIDTEIKLNGAIVDAYAKAYSLKMPNAMALLFPREVREIPPTELERVYPNLRVSALILTGWLSDRKTLTLDGLADLFTSSYNDWLRTREVRVNYDLVVDVAREAIREIASYLRLHLGIKPILDSAMAVIGRFDIYKSLLQDFSGITENEARLYIADIAAYIFVNQLLFYYIIPEKLGYDRLPELNPLSPPPDLLNLLDKQFDSGRLAYPHILGLNLFPLLIETRDQRIVYSAARLVSTFRAMRPQYIKEDLFGRLYHETIPPETRKNLGAFYTKPEAAKLLAILSIDKWDAKVLDPACGSGTLLVESYHRKAQLALFYYPSGQILKQDGTLAVVIPEEFFVGRSAGSVRRYLLNKGYRMKFVVRTSAEIAFSEGTLYRDYLVILKKGGKQSTLIMVILKKKLKELQNRIGDLTLEVKSFASLLDEKMSSEELDALKIFDADSLIKKHIDNLKPLVGFNTMKAQKLALELLTSLKNKPTLGDLAREELIRIRVYNPGQYRARGVEAYTRKLFASRYGTRSPNVVLLIDKIVDDNVYLRLRKAKLSTTLPISTTVPSLRTYSKVKHMDITGEEELAIVIPDSIPDVVLKLAGLVPVENAIDAARDIRDAYSNLAGNIQLVRRTQLSSPGLYWLTFCSDRNVLGTTSAVLNMKVDNTIWRKVLTLYLNSTIALLQLIAFVAETRGAWVTFHGNQVWHHIHVPNLKRLSNEKLRKATDLFDNIHKSNVKTVYQRIKERDRIQRSIDELALEMVGLNDWKKRLDELYEAVTIELETMHRILETSRRTQRRKRGRR